MISGKVAFDQLGSDQDLVGNTKVWFAALKNVRANLMPPAGRPRPTADEIKLLADWIKYDDFGLDPHNPEPGRATVRRLNRVEYGNTIRDLMGVDFNAEAAFPPDDTGRGFDVIGDVLTISPLLLEKYLQAADTIVKKAVPTVSSVVQKQVATGKDFTTDKNGVDGKSLNARNAATATHTFKVEQAENYRLGIDLFVAGSFNFSPLHCKVIGRVDGQEIFQEDVVWHERMPLHYEFTQQWAAGDHQIAFEVQPLGTVYEAPAPAPAATDLVPVAADAANAAAPVAAEAQGAVDNKNAVDAQGAADAKVDAKADAVADAVANVPDPNAAAAPAANAPAVPAAGRRGALGAGAAAAPTLAVRIDSVKVEGPLNEKFWVLPDNYTRFFPNGPAPTDPTARFAYAHDVMRAFATKAFRRPVDDAKVDQLASIARKTYELPGKTFEEGIARAMLAVLASPRFLFLVEDTEKTKPGETVAVVDEYALASRLSYFLWASMPDKELIDLAARGELRKNLAAQVDRMVQDDKSQGFVKNFVGQWLQARDIETVPINARVVAGGGAGFGAGGGRGGRGAGGPPPPNFDGPIRKFMHRETEMYFDYVMKQDRSVNEFIESNYAFLNEPLAKHYGLPPLTGNEIRLTTLPEDSPRGGLLTQGTILAVTSNPTRTSPVKRGAFILDNFLGTPPLPPPPNVPALEDAKKSFDHDPSLREMLAVHRTEPLCSSCHERMDPLGLALENFNAMGIWRDQDAKQPIETAGKLVTGETFNNVRELKHILTHERQQDFYRCLTEKMLTFALGRGLEYYDVETVDQIVDRLTRNDGHFSALLYGIIESAPFQKERLDGSGPAPVVANATAP